MIDASQNANRSKETEAAERLSRELSQPLCFLLSNLHAVRNRLEHDGPPSEDVARWVYGAFACANHIARLVVGIAAPVSEDEPARTPIGLRRVLESTVTMSELELRGRAQLVRRFEYEPQLAASETQLTQAFLALIHVVSVGLPCGRSRDNRVTVGLRAGADGECEIEFLGQHFGPVSVKGKRPPLLEAEVAAAARGVEAHGGRLAFESSAGLVRVKVWLPVG